MKKTRKNKKVILDAWGAWEDEPNRADSSWGSLPCGDFSAIEEETGNIPFAIIDRRDKIGKLVIKSWRGWLRFLAIQLKRELSEGIANEHKNQFESGFNDIMRFINIAIAGEDQFILDEKLEIDYYKSE